MEEAMVDVAFDLNLPPPETTLQPGGQEDMFTKNRDQTHILANVQKSSPASHRWSQNRAAWVETLRVSIAAGTYQVDSAELAQCILRNSTRFLEMC